MPRIGTVSLQFEPPATLREDLSAVVRLPDGALLLASDERSHLELLTLSEADRFANHHTFPLTDFFDLPDPAGEVDLEGLTLAGDDLWLVGSHSIRIRKPKAESVDAKSIDRMAFARNDFQLNRSLIARIPLDQGVPVRVQGDRTAARFDINPEGGNELTDTLAVDPHIGPFITAKIPSKANGFDVEGLAALPEGGLLIGLRGPVLLEQAFLIEIRPRPSKSEPQRLKLDRLTPDGPRYRKYFVNLHGLGVRDLCWFDDDLLILAGPTMYLDGPAMLFSLPRAELVPERLLRPKLLESIPFGHGEEHAEGITRFDADSILVVFDGPSKDRLDGPCGVRADRYRMK